MSDDIIEIDEHDDDAYRMDKETAAALLDAVEAGDSALLDDLFEPFHAADIADFIEQIDSSDRKALISIWAGGIDGEILSELEESVREEVIDYLAPEALADAVRDMESDDVVDLVEFLDKPEQDAILNALGDAERVAVEKALSYPEYSAGRLMQREVVMGPEHWTVGDAIDFLRSQDELPDEFYHMILVDPRLKPVGQVTLGKLLGSTRTTKLTDLKEESFRTIRVTQPEGDVAYAFNQYHLISAPVVDEDDRLVGVITIDDAMIVLDEEAEEDILRLAGVGEGSLSDRVLETTKQRLPWLGVNLLTAILASLVISQFEATIAQFVALAVLMPIVASMGGNAGTQALTVAVRAMATRDLTASNVWRVVRREAMVGLINGVVFAVVMGLVGVLWFGSPVLGAVIAVAMVVNLLVAALAGILVPVAMEKIGVDPALASGTFVTTVTDVVGFFAFLGLATLVLM